MSNRRRSERHDVSLPVVIKGPRGIDTTLTANVSAHGIAVFTDRTLPLRHYVELELTLPPANTKVNTTAMVVRNSERLVDRAGLTHPGIAFDFYLFDAVGRAAWWAYMDRLAAAAKSPPAPAPAPPAPEPEKPSPPPEEDPTVTFLVTPGDIGRLWAFFRTELNQGALRLESPVVKPPGTPVEVLIVHPATEAEWSLPGEVRAASPHGRGRGPMLEVRLEPLDRDLREAFKTFITTGVSPFAAAPPIVAPPPAAKPPAPPPPRRPPTFAAFFAEAELGDKND